MYFLNINKPKNLTSFDVIRFLRKKLKIKAIGHSGTLDPLATGVMQVAVGAATKLLDFLESDKEYIASIKFGYVSETFDDEGEKKFIKKPDFTKEDLVQCLNDFVGKKMQIPPKYSAIKQNGKKLCDILRKNPNADIKPKEREIEIYSIELLDFNAFDEARIKVFCKKGTYIRSLANDIGKRLSCGAYITDLIRTKAGNFDIKDSQCLDCENYQKINPLDVIKLDKKELNDAEYERISNGNFIQADKNFSTETILLIKNNKLVSVAILSDNLIKPKKNFLREN